MAKQAEKKVIKKKVSTVKAKKKPVAPKLIGKVSHYFDNIKVAVIKVKAPLKKGDSLLFEGGDTLFSQKITSMEKDHKKVVAVKKGAEVGMKVKQKVREGYRVYKKA